MQSGGVKFDWQFDIIEDLPPEIVLSQPVQVTVRNALQLKYKITDDYGVTSAKARIFINERPSSAGIEDPDRPLGEEPKFSLVLPSTKNNSEAMTYKDLTSHPWAGSQAFLSLSARDEAGQVTRTKKVQIKLPIRRFTNPLAKAIIEQRNKLVMKPRSKPLCGDARITWRLLLFLSNL